MTAPARSLLLVALAGALGGCGGAAGPAANDAACAALPGGELRVRFASQPDGTIAAFTSSGVEITRNEGVVQIVRVDGTALVYLSDRGQLSATAPCDAREVEVVFDDTDVPFDVTALPTAFGGDALATASSRGGGAEPLGDGFERLALSSPEPAPAIRRVDLTASAVDPSLAALIRELAFR